MKFIKILKKIIIESINKSYPIGPPEVNEYGRGENEVVYYFTVEETKTVYEVSFFSDHTRKPVEGKYHWLTEINYDVKTNDESNSDEELFYYDKDDDKKEDTDEFKASYVLATIVSIMRDFISKYKPEYMTYTGVLSNKEKNSGLDIAVTKRDRIYDSLVKRELSDLLEYSFERVGPTAYIKYKGKTPIKGRHKIFNNI